MTTVYDVPSENLIKKLAEKLKAIEVCKQPEWAPFVKTGVNREKAPTDPDWWYVREAAILRKVYVKGPIGTMHLRAEFTGTRDRGSKPNIAKMSSGSIVRTALQQLEEAQLVRTVKGKGREVTPAGRKLLDNTAYEVLKEVIKDHPDLGKY
jgi:small subunit ribosomal protein S19e